MQREIDQLKKRGWYKRKDLGMSQKFNDGDVVSLNLVLEKATVEQRNHDGTYELSYTDGARERALDWIPESALTHIQPTPKPGDVWLINDKVYVAIVITYGTVLKAANGEDESILTADIEGGILSSLKAELLFRPELTL